MKFLMRLFHSCQLIWKIIQKDLISVCYVSLDTLLSLSKMCFEMGSLIVFLRSNIVKNLNLLMKMDF